MKSGKINTKLDVPIKVSIIEDDDWIRENLASQIRHTEGFICSGCYRNGEEALAMVKQYPIDLVVLDLKMPGLQGTDILKEIKRQHSDIEIIVLTGYGSLDFRSTWMKRSPRRG